MSAAKEKSFHSPLTREESDSLSMGDITISNEVISMLATQAAGKIEGVQVVDSSFRLTEILSGEGTHKGVSVKTDAESGHVEIDLEITVHYGVVIYDVAHELQVLVKDEVEALTGSLNVDKVNVRVRRVIVAPDAGGKEPVSPDQAIDSGLGDMEEEDI